MKSDLAKNSMKLSNRQLRQYNGLLRKNLKFLISCSATNEKTEDRVDEMEDALHACHSAKELFDVLVIQGKRIFAMESITASLLPELRRLYPPEYQSSLVSHFINQENIQFLKGELMEFHFGDPTTPLLRSKVRRGTPDFFPDAQAGSIRSEALVPIHNGERLIAVIAFGSNNPSRFLEEHGRRFLRRLGRTVVLKTELFMAEHEVMNTNRREAV